MTSRPPNVQRETSESVDEVEGFEFIRRWALISPAGKPSRPFCRLAFGKDEDHCEPSSTGLLICSAAVTAVGSGGVLFSVDSRRPSSSATVSNAKASTNNKVARASSICR